jgi:hypothetical protein
VPGVGTKTWTLRLSKNTYRFVCDPHHTIMHGSWEGAQSSSGPAIEVAGARR